LLKWGTLGSNRLKCTGYRWAPNLLKSVALAPGVLEERRSLHPAPTGASAKRSSIHAASKVAKVGAAGGPKLLKWGRFRGRGRVKSAKVRPQAASHKKVFAPQKGLRSAGGPKLLKRGLSGRGSNLLKSDRPLTSRTPGWSRRLQGALLE
jgi:hypothetical protein